MLAKLIRWSIDNRVFVIVTTLLLSGWGLLSVKQTSLDAIPDLSDVQVIVRTSFPGQSPQVVENQVTYPITTTMLSVPGAQAVRGYSFFGDSYVYIVFKDGTDLYWARTRVLEYLNQAIDSLPEGIKPRIGPDATGVGWVYSYALVDKSGQHDLAQLRSLQDWFLKFELQTVPGVAEVATVGGMVKQYQVIANPEQLRAYGIPLKKLESAIKKSNTEVGGSVIELAEAEYMVHTRGYLTSVADIERIPVMVRENGIPLLVRDLATVQIGPQMRRVVSDLDGEGEVTGGIVVMRYGENALATIESVKKKLKELQHGLPKGVEIVATYDRSDLILNAVDNLSNKLIQEFIVVALVCLLFLFHIRSAFVAIVTLPLGILTAFIVMHWQGINANIMSLGGIAIAIGAMVDAAIVMIENAHKHIERWYKNNVGKSLSTNERWQLITNASCEVGPALFFSLLIITLSFLPVFTLEAQEGRLFSPLAFTKTYAMAAAAGLAVTLVPVLMGYFIRGCIPDEKNNSISRWLIKTYQPLLLKVLLQPRKTLILALMLMLTIVLPIGGISGLLSPLKWPVEFAGLVMSPVEDKSLRANYLDTITDWQTSVATSWRDTFKLVPLIARFASGLGKEFMPDLFEGDLMYMPTTLPGLSIGKAQQLLQQTDRLIKSLPEVKRVFGKIGRADTATDPAPLTMIETIIQLKPRDEWREGMTLEKLIDELDRTVNFPGLTNAWLMPIKTRIDMLSTGIKTPVGIKVSGPDLKVIEAIGRKLESVLTKVRGTTSAYSERVAGGRYIEIVPDRDKAAFLGINIQEINEVVRAAVGGINVTSTVEGLERYPVNLRFAREVRDNLEKLREIPVISPTGAEIPLGEVADIRIVDGPPMLKSENARLNGWTFVDIRGVDLGSYVQNAQRVVNQEIELPPGYSISWAGQYEYLLRASDKLLQVVPLTLMIIFLLLYLTFRRIEEVVLVMATVPFALVGGYWFIFLLGYHMSVATAVGFIALAGVAAEFGVIMLVYLDNAVKDRLNNKQLNTKQDLVDTIMEGAVMRVRPKAMTVAVIFAGLIPIMLGQGTGSEVMQRIAAPMIGGMITAPILSLFVIPAFYFLWKQRELKFQ
ncbi:MAG: efflux RND transporter permease subunit [Gammaproteobacteria bacterium]|nr:efflux RND transporter permease subunit [Gammaproteobacteria bacterium]